MGHGDLGHGDLGHGDLGHGDLGHGDLGHGYEYCIGAAHIGPSLAWCLCVVWVCKKKSCLGTLKFLA